MCEKTDQWILMDELRSGGSCGGGIACQDLLRQDVEDERHTDVLERVLAGNTAIAAPLPFQKTVQNEHNRTAATPPTLYLLNIGQGKIPGKRGKGAWIVVEKLSCQQVIKYEVKPLSPDHFAIDAAGGFKQARKIYK